MTVTYVFASIACCLVSAAIGYLTAVIGKRAVPNGAESASHEDAGADPARAKAEKQLKKLVEALYDLTSQVGTQVGEHSQRVTEITNSLESPDDVGSSMVLAAGKLLVSANQKLQADLEEAKSEIQRQREQTKACLKESRTDALTNLANRRAFDMEISRTFAQFRRDSESFSLLIIDIDHFKRINDKYGHMVGDQLLKGFSRRLTNTFRESDFVARFGGEEFVAILPKTPLQEGLKAAERIRAAVADGRFKVGDLEIQITASVGVKEVEQDEVDTELLEAADMALYAAKAGGRNRCYYHDGTSCVLFVPVVKTETPEGELPADAASDGSIEAGVETPTDESAEINIETDSLYQVMPPHLSMKIAAAGNIDRQVQV